MVVVDRAHRAVRRRHWQASNRSTSWCSAVHCTAVRGAFELLLVDGVDSRSMVMAVSGALTLFEHVKNIYYLYGDISSPTAKAYLRTVSNVAKDKPLPVLGGGLKRNSNSFFFFFEQMKRPIMTAPVSYPSMGQICVMSNMTATAVSHQRGQICGMST